MNKALFLTLEVKKFLEKVDEAFWEIVWFFFPHIDGGY